MHARTLRIDFVVGFIGKTGGIAVVLEYAHRLGKLGHDVRVYYPLLPYDAYTAPGPALRRWAARLRKFARNFRERGRGVRWFPGSIDARPVPFIADRFLRDADAVFATDWPTAPDVAKLSPAKGSKYYLVQGHEVWHGRAREVEATYKLPLRILVIAPWLNDLLRSRFGRVPDAEIRNGVDLEFFRPPAHRSPGPPSILMMYHTQPLKGIGDGLAVLRRLHRERPEAVIRMFGLYPFPECDDFISYTRDPSPEELRNLYQASDIYLCPSHNEGWHLTPMEAMACGCAVIATEVGCIPALHEGCNMLVAAPRDIETLYRHLLSLVDDRAKSRDLAERGRATISRYGWDQAAARLEAVLASATDRRNGKEPPASIRS